MYLFCPDKDAVKSFMELFLKQLRGNINIVWPWDSEILGPQWWASVGAARSLPPYGSFTSCMKWKMACAPDQRHMAGQRQKRALQWDCKNGKRCTPWLWYWGDICKVQTLLEEGQPIFNTNYLTDESEAWEGHTSFWNDKDRAKNVIIRFHQSYPLATIKVCTISNGNLSNSWDI